MATKLPRLSVTFPVDLFALIRRAAEVSERSVSNQIVWDLKQLYVAKKMEAEMFNPTQLGEEERPKAPVFRMKDVPDESALPKRREPPGQ